MSLLPSPLRSRSSSPAETVFEKKPHHAQTQDRQQRPVSHVGVDFSAIDPAHTEFGMPNAERPLVSLRIFRSIVSGIRKARSW